MTYHRPIQIEFNHCDPAGIVFFPRYYQMVSSVCENFHKAIAGLRAGPESRVMAARNARPHEAFRTAQTP